MIIDFFKGNKATVKTQDKSMEKLYFKQMEAIDVQWAVISNLRAYTSDEARNLELLCLQNIQIYNKIAGNYRSTGREEPHHAPGYVRLCMLYEKQKRFEDAVLICKQAIENGAYEDGSKGKMHGRLARLLRKAAAQIPDDQVIGEK